MAHSLSLASDHTSHRELNALIPRLAAELGVQATWVPTDSDFDIRSFDGVWLVPGSPYVSDDAVYEALRLIRTEGIPLLGTCGGMQYAVVEYLRNALGTAATHAESDGEGDDNAIATLEAGGVIVGARAEDAGAEVLDFSADSFFLTSMFQPQVGAAAGEPIHRLIREFVSAVFVAAN